MLQQTFKIVKRIYGIRPKLFAVAIFFVVLVIVILNIKCEHIKLDTDSNRTSFYYYLSEHMYSAESYVSLLSIYPLLTFIMIMLFGKSQRFIFLFWGLLGIVFTVLQWVLMRLHFDATIISYGFSYYSTLLMGFLSVVGCGIVLFRKKDDRLMDKGIGNSRSVNLELFVKQLKQVIEWTSFLADGFDFSNGNYGAVFRNTNPLVNGKQAFNIDFDCTTWNIDDCDIGNYITLLEHAIIIRDQYTPGRKDFSFSGRILCFETCVTTHDGAAIVESNCFFDESDVPPIDTWFYLEKAAHTNERAILFCWIPVGFESVVTEGIKVEMMGSYSWLDEKDPVLYNRIVNLLQDMNVTESF